ncbi:hypothetical protein ACP70R_003870 [Stipagrostis hirtigluma subsp. patula]
MEATVVSIGKAVLDGALGYAKSAAAEEMALQLGVERDVSFVTDELEMMQSFLMTADEERDQNNKVLNTWVKQVRDVAYNVEDNLVDFTIHAEREKPPFLGCIPRNPCDRRRIALEVKELKAKVEEVSNRNLRYRLIKDGAGGSKPTAAGVEQGVIAGSAAAIFGVDEDWRSAMKQEPSKVELTQLIVSEAVELRVITVWGTSGDLGKTSEIRKAYGDPKVKAKFRRRAWVRVMHPFDPKEFLHSLVRQFYVDSQEEEASVDQEGTTVGANILLKMEKMGQSDLVRMFSAQLSCNSYLIVINDLSTIEDWDCIKSYFSDKKNGSRIVVATQQIEIASLCTKQPYRVSVLKQLSSDQILYLFHKKVEKPETDFAKTILGSTTVTSTSEIEEEGARQENSMGGQDVVSTASTVEKNLDRSTTKTVIPEDVVVGRATEKQKVIDLVLPNPNDVDSHKVVSVWGMGGIGKTTLVRSVYRSQQLGGWKRAWATALRPFNRGALLRNLALQLQTGIQEDSASAGDTQKNIGAIRYEETANELSRLLDLHKCLIVLDDLSSREEWDSIKHHFLKARRIIVTTREKFVAKHCSEDDLNMYSLKGLDEDAALDLFKKKVYKNAAGVELHSSMLDQAKLILQKCDGLPLAISTIGGYLANKPKTTMEWRKLNDGISAELEINPELKMIKAVLMRSYDGLPYHLKASFLYLSIFPEDFKIKRKHIVRRWVAEGFSRDMQHMIAEQVGDKHFDELLDRSMTLASEGENHGNIDSCVLHDLIREICISKAREENLVFTLEEGCSLGGTQGAIRHLTISSNWKRDKEMMQRTLDLSHVRSLTVFGEWRSFFISSKMRFLRVLDLEHTIGLRDHHLDQIGELLHLRFLSLRGCQGIFELPSSLGNLRQLQTLDVRGTRLWALPTAVTKLQKLQYLHACIDWSSNDIYDKYIDITVDRCDVFLESLEEKQHKACTCFSRAVLCLHKAHVLCRPKLLDAHSTRSKSDLFVEGMSRCDIRNQHSTLIKFGETNENNWCGVKVPRGISKLRALHTLRVVNVAWGYATFQELGGLTQLRKLGVTGVSKENSDKFWLAVAGHDQLLSLSIDYGGNKPEDVELDGCLGADLWLPKCLESLKMHGRLVKVTEWIHQLQNLSKLQLEKTKLKQDAIEAIGQLPNLAVLRLKHFSVHGMQLRFLGLSFPSLLVLELEDYLDSVEFEQEAMPKLEVLQATKRCRILQTITGLHFLTSLKEIRLDDGRRHKKTIQRALAEYPNNVTLKML